jgi:hypothetical protein
MKITSAPKSSVLRKVKPIRPLKKTKKQKPKIRSIRKIIQAQNGSGNRRGVIIDGENVAYNEIRRTFGEGPSRIQRCLEWFQRQGCEAKIAVPSSLLKTINLDNRGVLVHECGTQNPNENPQIEANICQQALEEDLAIVSERTFQNMHLNNRQFQPLIENRVIGYTFFKDQIFIPSDPYGRYGPLLNNILNK